MGFIINVLPNQQCIHFIDQVMNTYMQLYNLPYQKELCFVVHELIINSVEAMTVAGKSETESIELAFQHDEKEIVITVTDNGGGITEEQWDKVVQYDLEKQLYSDRGRGLFFVKNMVDHMLFKQASDTKFLISVSKKIIV